MKRPAYFDSQASAAAVLGISINNIRQAKAAGCPAFRSGRVYRDDLLTWFEEKRRLRAAKPDRDRRIDRTIPVAKAILALTDCVNLGLIPEGRYFELGTEVVASITDELTDWSEGDPLIREWAGNMISYLSGEFETPIAAEKVYPKLIAWLNRVTSKIKNKPR